MAKRFDKLSVTHKKYFRCNPVYLTSKPATVKVFFLASVSISSNSLLITKNTEMKTRALILITILAITSCGKNSSPDGRAQLRDQALTERIAALEQKQIVILDSLHLLNEKMKSIGSK
jgi:hypothetical protein